jgi:hypothetical protein
VELHLKRRKERRAGPDGFDQLNGFAVMTGHSGDGRAHARLHSVAALRMDASASTVGVEIAASDEHQ